MATILVTGGTGTLGRQVVDRLRTDGHTVRALSRSSEPYAVDLRDDDSRGLDEALRGVDVVVHCASSASPRGGDDRAAAHLVESAVRAKIPHLVYVSIVGVDRLPLGYHRTKRVVERMVEDSGLGWTILRTTQFHDLVLRMLEGATKLPVAALLPAEVRLQPVGSAEVASRLADLATRPPSGRVPDIGGPEILTVRELADVYLRATGHKRRVLPMPLFGKAYASYRRGDQLVPERAVGKETFEDFLATRKM
ncbi:MULTISPECIES: SDR family oxidoreductase [Streptomyces]|uniref:SDR family oxidoreductase n=1 Tax=Streptomyces TaxID=1883 RepID=UPI00084C148D|nr:MULTISPECIES: SDR family oxidoreductase [Streptomyces]TFI21412.1 SDR family oxidoreductase [Streptomyces sp. 4R-3d]